MSFYQHETAIVDNGAQIGEGSRVWHFVHVCGGAKIGKGVSLGQNVFVGNRVVIGDHCKVQNNVSVYDNVTLEEGFFVAQAWYLRMFITRVPSLSVKTNTETPW
ncbi:lipopolysaccharides biosynthesis acetyltransferase [Acinetobacter baumannii 1457504]|nr:lipopolysaccharides biosynthesis acetyltransferase [Acinetobacter baumannii 1457504]